MWPWQHNEEECTRDYPSFWQRWVSLSTASLLSWQVRNEVQRETVIWQWMKSDGNVKHDSTLSLFHLDSLRFCWRWHSLSVPESFLWNVASDSIEPEAILEWDPWFSDCESKIHDDLNHQFSSGYLMAHFQFWRVDIGPPCMDICLTRLKFYYKVKTLSCHPWFCPRCGSPYQDVKCVLMCKKCVKLLVCILHAIKCVLVCKK